MMGCLAPDRERRGQYSRRAQPFPGSGRMHGKGLGQVFPFCGPSAEESAGDKGFANNRRVRLDAGKAAQLVHRTLPNHRQKAKRPVQVHVAKLARVPDAMHAQLFRLSAADAPDVRARGFLQKFLGQR